MAVDFVSKAKKNTSTNTNGGGASSTASKNKVDFVSTAKANSIDFASKMQQQTNEVPVKEVSEPVNKWAQYTDSEYKLSDSDKKDIKSEYDRLKKLGYGGQGNASAYAWQNALKNGETVEHAEEVEKAYQRTNNMGESFLHGVGNSMAKPLTTIGSLVEKGINKVSGSDTDYMQTMNKSREDIHDANKDAHSLSTTAGDLVGNLINYKALSKLPMLDKVSTGIGTKLGGGKIANAVGNITADTLQDLVLDTLPELGNNVIDGKSGSEIAKDTAKNIGTNLAFNVGGEVIGGLAGKAVGNIVDKYKKNKGIKEATEEVVEQVAKQTDDVADNVADVTKNVETPKVEEIVKSVDDVDNATKESVGNVNSDVGNAKDISGDKVSATRTNTLENSGINTREELDSIYLDENLFKYDSVTEKESIEGAIKAISSDPQGAYKEAMEKGTENVSHQDVDTLFIYYRKLISEARATEDAVAKADLMKQASDTFKRIQQIGTQGGQAIQAFAKWSRNTTEGMLSETLRSTEKKLRKEFGDKVAEDIIEKISVNELNNIEDLLREAEEAGLDSREAKIALARVGQIVDKYSPKKIKDRVTTVLMDNMLGNFRTLISRNAGGNVGYNAMEFLRQPISATVDKALSLKTGKRTRTGWSKDKMTSYLGGFTKGISEELDDLKKGIHTAKSGENTVTNALGLNSHSFSVNHSTKSEGMNKLLDVTGKVSNKLDDMVKHGLSAGDRPFYEAAYAQRISELTDLYNKGQLGAEVQQLAPEQFEVMAKASAKLDGLMATYQNEGAWSNALAGIKKSIGEASEGTVGVDILSQFATPFVRTPGNIIERAIEYSPLGFVKNAAESISDATKGKAFNQQRFVDEFGRSTLGSAGLLGAVALADKGIVNGAYDDDKDVAQMQKNNGMIEYGVNLPNGGNVDLSFMPVVGSLLTEGAAISDAIKKNPDMSQGDKLVTGTSAMINNLIDSSALQGLQRLVGGSNTYSTAGLGENIQNTFESGLGQLVPSWLRQVASVTDDYQRDISSGDNSYAINNLINSIPVLRENKLEPKVDNEGEFVLQNQGRGIGSKIFENMFLPGTYKTQSSTALDDEAMRIYNSEDPDAKGSKIQFATTPTRKDITTEDYSPTDEEYRVYKQNVGQAKNDIGNALIESEVYQSASDVDKAKMLQDAYASAKAYAKVDAVPDFDTNDKVAKIYRDKGSEGVVTYLDIKANADTDKNGSIKQAELQEYLDKLNVSKEYKAYYWSIIQPKAKNNPYK